MEAQRLLHYFSFVLQQLLQGHFFFISYLGKWNHVKVVLPSHLLLFIVLTIYILVNGLIKNSIGLTHYYWFSAATFLIALYYWMGCLIANNKVDKQRVQNYFYYGIIFLAFAEALIVMLQYGRHFPVPNSSFRCTGTWVNPNVTAMFLALSLFAVINAYKQQYLQVKKIIFGIALLIVLAAIVVLLCRSAYIVTLILLYCGFRPNSFESFILKFKQFSWIYKSALLLLLPVVLVFASVSFKQTSAFNRLGIWKQSTQLFLKNPVSGYGIGMFEKEYNLFAAQNQNKDNEHINMPYNDFLEMSIEGGTLAVMLWSAFILATGYYCLRQNHLRLLPVLLSFCIIQLTNFGFQAIPVFVLFLSYIGIETAPIFPEGDFVKNIFVKSNNRIILGIVLLLSSTYLFFTISQLSGAFYRKWQLSTYTGNNKIIEEYKLLNSKLYPYASYQEGLGNLFLDVKDYKTALHHFLLAQQRASRPELFIKAGYCYQKLERYKNSEENYRIASNMEPHKFIPHDALLKLFQQKNDTASAIAEANVIINLPVKVNNPKVEQIKLYADSILKKLNTIQK